MMCNKYVCQLKIIADSDRESRSHHAGMLLIPWFRCFVASPVKTDWNTAVDELDESKLTSNLKLATSQHGRLVLNSTDPFKLQPSQIAADFSDPRYLQATRSAHMHSPNSKEHHRIDTSHTTPTRICPTSKSHRTSCVSRLYRSAWPRPTWLATRASRRFPPPLVLHLLPRPRTRHRIAGTAPEQALHHISGLFYAWTDCHF